MTGLGVAALFAAVAVCNAATLQELRLESRVVRREQRLEMTSHGDLIDASDDSRSPETLVKTGVVEKSKTKEKAEYCDYDFPLGTVDTNTCTDAAKESLILDKDMCIAAAEFSGKPTTHGDFEIPQGGVAEWENRRPQGCFMFGTPAHYYYNGNANPPHPMFHGHILEGTPVCSRPMFLNATLDSNTGCPTTSNPKGYHVIDNEDECRNMASCKSYPEGTQFKIGDEDPVNTTQHLDHPRGCQIDDTTDMVYYNGPSVVWGARTSKSPTGIHGTLVCHVEHNSAGGTGAHTNQSSTAGAAPAVAHAAAATTAAPAEAATTAAP